MKKNTLLVALIILLTASLKAQQQHRLYDNVSTIRKFDKIYPITQNPIVFVGSSSIRRWSSLQEAFSNYNVINIGIGGAVVDDILYYLDDLVFVYNPRQIVIYVGENDLPKEENSPQLILDKTKVLLNAIRKKLPLTPIVYIGLKPSPSREKYLAKCREVNKLIKEYLSTQKSIKYVDVFSSMMQGDKPIRGLFVSDRLHMNAKGYAIWERRIRSELIKTR